MWGDSELEKDKNLEVQHQHGPSVSHLSVCFNANQPGAVHPRDCFGISGRIRYIYHPGSLEFIAQSSFIDQHLHSDKTPNEEHKTCDVSQNCCLFQGFGPLCLTRQCQTTITMSVNMLKYKKSPR